MEFLKSYDEAMEFLQKFMSYSDAAYKLGLVDSYGTQTVYDKNDRVRGTINQNGDGYRFVYKNTVMIY